MERLVVALVVVVLDKSRNGVLKLPGKAVVVQADDILERAMPGSILPWVMGW